MEEYVEDSRTYCTRLYVLHVHNYRKTVKLYSYFYWGTGYRVHVPDAAPRIFEGLAITRGWMTDLLNVMIIHPHKRTHFFVSGIIDPPLVMRINTSSIERLTMTGPDNAIMCNLINIHTHAGAQCLNENC